MHKITTVTAVRAYSAPPETPAGFRGPTSKGRREQTGWRNGGGGGERRDGRGPERDCPTLLKSQWCHSLEKPTFCT